MPENDKSAPRVEALRARQKKAGLKRCELWVPAELVGAFQAFAKRLCGKPGRYPLLLTAHELEALVALQSDHPAISRVTEKAKALRDAASAPKSLQATPVAPANSGQVLSMHRELLALLPPRRSKLPRPPATPPSPQ